MPKLTISPKYQVVIPKAIRQQLGLKPGQQVEVISYGDRIVLVPVRPMSELRGSMPGLDTAVEREGDRV